MDYVEAKKIVEQKVFSKLTFRASVIDRLTKEYDQFWVIFYDSDIFIQTDELKYLRIGRQPAFICKNDGTVFRTEEQLIDMPASIEHFQKFGEPDVKYTKL